MMSATIAISMRVKPDRPASGSSRRIGAAGVDLTPRRDPWALSGECPSGRRSRLEIALIAERYSRFKSALSGGGCECLRAFPPASRPGLDDHNGSAIERFVGGMDATKSGGAMTHGVGVGARLDRYDCGILPGAGFGSAAAMGAVHIGFWVLPVFGRGYPLAAGAGAIRMGVGGGGGSARAVDPDPKRDKESEIRKSASPPPPPPPPCRRTGNRARRRPGRCRDRGGGLHLPPSYAGSCHRRDSRSVPGQQAGSTHSLSCLPSLCRPTGRQLVSAPLDGPASSEPVRSTLPCLHRWTTESSSTPMARLTVPITAIGFWSCLRLACLPMGLTSSGRAFYNSFAGEAGLPKRKTSGKTVGNDLDSDSPLSSGGGGGAVDSSGEDAGGLGVAISGRRAYRARQGATKGTPMAAARPLPP